MLNFCDEFGPQKLVDIYNPRVGLEAVVAIDNTAAGPAIGGVRMAPDVTREEAFRLARAMTLKNAAAGLAHGGGKSVIKADPKALTEAEKEVLIRAFARAIRDLKEYIPGPDMGTNEIAMAWVKDEIGRSVGLPKVIGGIPLDEIGATGWGLLAAGEAAARKMEMSLQGARVVVQGFGAVGKFAAKFFAEKGALLVGAADSQGTISDPSGLDVDALMALKAAGKSVVDHHKGDKKDPIAVVKVPCDIWIPAARPDIVTEENVDQLQTRLILQGANIPITEGAEQILHDQGVVVIPDFIANAGGVICAAVEYHQGTEKAAMQTVRERIDMNTTEVLIKSGEEQVNPRADAMMMARERVEKAMKFSWG